MNKGKGTVSPELNIVLLCKQMQWDYHTYMSQPEWFIDLVNIVNNVEAHYQNQMNKINAKRH